MKILLVTSDGFGAAMGDRLVREGNDVVMFTAEKEARDIHKGILTQTDDYKKVLSGVDYCIFTNNKLVPIWKECVKVKPCYGGSEAGQKLEDDRLGAAKLAKSLGFKIPESLGVKTVEEAEKHLTSHKAKHVLKFTGGNTDSDDVLLGEYEDSRDLIRFCHFIEQSGKHWDSIEIQELIEGIEAGCSAYFDGQKWAPGIEINFQGKRFASGEQGNGIGFLTGEMHTVIKYADESSPFFQRTLGRMADHLREVGYKGEIDAGCIVTPDGDYFIELTPRTGIPDYMIRFPLQITPVGELFYGIATGDVKENKIRPDWAIGAVILTPGFPDSKSSEKRTVGLPIIGYEGNEENCHLIEARRGKDGLEMSDGGYGYCGVVTGRGPTVESARRNCYWIVKRANKKRVSVPKSWYRDDAGERVIENKEEIIDLKILTPEEWGDD